jgi:aspartate/methionine/tyrosine aminotransferase
MYDKKRKMMMKILESCKIGFHQPDGAYYILADAPEAFADGQEYTRFLLENAKVAVLPAVALYQDKKLGSRKVRLAFCKKDETLQEVERRFSKVKLN